MTRPIGSTRRCSFPVTKPNAHLLPIYDEYFIGLKDRSAMGQRMRKAKAEPGEVLFANIACVDGQVVGGWKRSIDKNSVAVTLTALVRLTAAEKSRIAEQAERFGTFLGLPVSLTIG